MYYNTGLWVTNSIKLKISLKSRSNSSTQGIFSLSNNCDDVFTQRRSDNTRAQSNTCLNYLIPIRSKLNEN